MERIEDEALRHALRRRAGVIVAQSLMIAAAATIAVAIAVRVLAPGRAWPAVVSASSSPG